MGAWIETLAGGAKYVAKYVSHSIWVRGLKHVVVLNYFVSIHVALYMGAWIETDPER